MSTKTISVTDEAYGRLYNKKKEKESFSEVILRLTGKRSLTEFAGVFTVRQTKELESNIMENRKTSRNRLARIRV